MITLITAFAFTFPSVAISFGVVYFFMMKGIKKAKLSNKPLSIAILISWTFSALPVAFFGEKVYGSYYLIVPIVITSVVLYITNNIIKHKSASKKMDGSI